MGCSNEPPQGHSSYIWRPGPGSQGREWVWKPTRQSWWQRPWMPCPRTERWAFSRPVQQAHSTVGDFLDCLQKDAVNPSLHYCCMFPMALELNLGVKESVFETLMDNDSSLLSKLLPSWCQSLVVCVRLGGKETKTKQKHWEFSSHLWSTSCLFLWSPAF